MTVMQMDTRSLIKKEPCKRWSLRVLMYQS